MFGSGNSLFCVDIQKPHNYHINLFFFLTCRDSNNNSILYCGRICSSVNNMYSNSLYSSIEEKKKEDVQTELLLISSTPFMFKPRLIFILFISL